MNSSGDECSSQNRPGTLIKKVPLEMMNYITPRSLFSPDSSMLRCTDKSKLSRLIEMLGNEAELEQGRLPSEEAGYVYEGPMDENATHVLPTKSRDVKRGIAVVDGMVSIENAVHLHRNSY